MEEVKISFIVGSTINEAVEQMKRFSKIHGCVCYGDFNGIKITSNDTLDEAYIKITGNTEKECEELKKRKEEEYERKLAEHKASIPQKTKEYIKKARGLVLDEELDNWDKIVPIRLNDLYCGKELEQVLDICKIMRDESFTDDEKLHKAYDLFMNAGNSGMLANLTSKMISVFCPNGKEIADAVMNFKFENNK